MYLGVMRLLTTAFDILTIAATAAKQAAIIVVAVPVVAAVAIVHAAGPRIDRADLGRDTSLWWCLRCRDYVHMPHSHRAPARYWS